MPLPMAHGLLGASIVALIHPKADLKNWKPLLIGFALANAPDFDFFLVLLSGYRGFHRGITHSLFFALIVGGIIYYFLKGKSWRISLAYWLAFLSHALLDFATAKTGAVRLLTPFSNREFRLGLISLSELPRGFIISDMLYFSAVEALIFAPVFLFVLIIRRNV